MNAHPEVLDREEQTMERRIELVQMRTDEIFAKRWPDVSAEDMSIALETITTMPGLLDTLRKMVVEQNDMCGAALNGMVHGLLMADSVQQATKEIGALFSEPISRERH